MMQAQALRVCSGAIKSSPVPALQVELGELPLELRRMQLMTNYWANLQGHNNSHLTKGVLQECWENGRSHRDNFARIGNDVAKEFGIFEMKISPIVVYPAVAPWMLVWPEVDWYLLEAKRKGIGTTDLVNAFRYHVMKEYSDFTQIYTDSAKQPDTEVTGFGMAVPEKRIGINRRTSYKLGV